MNLNLRHFLGYIKQFVSAWDSLGIPSWWMQFQHPPTGYRFSRAVAVGPNYWSFGGGFRVSVANTRAKLEWVKRGQARIGAVDGILDGRRAKGKKGRKEGSWKSWKLGRWACFRPRSSLFAPLSSIFSRHSKFSKFRNWKNFDALIIYQELATLPVLSCIVYNLDNPVDVCTHTHTHRRCYKV